VYYQAAPVTAADLVLMRRIDELHLELPFAGSRMLRDLLVQEGYRVFRATEVALYHVLGKLPEPPLAHRFC